MKQVVFIFGLLSSLLLPTPTQAIEDLRTEPEPEVWIMSAEICKDFPPELDDAVKRGIVFQPWLRAAQQCRWFGISNNTLTNDNELATWPTYQDCMDSHIPTPEGFTLRKKSCQSVKELSN